MLLNRSISSAFRQLRSNISNWTNNHPLFKHRQVTSSVWQIEEKYFDSWNLANIFFINGSTCDLLVDTGIGVHDLPRYLLWSKIREEREKPLIVALTHSHFDHSGGAYQFQNLPGVGAIYAHKDEIDIYRRPSKYLTASWIIPNEVWPKPEGWSAQDYNVKPVKKDILKPIDEGHIFDLGNKLIKVLHVPGHSKGSLALHCAEEGFIATGDTVYKTDHELIDWYPQSSVRKMKRSVERILSIANESRVEFALPGHNEVLTKDETVKACECHLLQSTGNSRTIRKSLSRTRASLILALNSNCVLPSRAREWIKQ